MKELHLVISLINPLVDLYKVILCMFVFNYFGAF